MLRPFGSPRWVDEGYTSTNAQKKDSSNDSLVGVVVRIDVEGTTRLSLGCRVVRCVRGSSPLCVRRVLGVGQIKLTSGIRHSVQASKHVRCP